ncbi:MAG: amidohydrolase [Saprospirales bacterium]|nr:amidohydrolase [Saprospirales bacterium]MBK8489551.1 amidohydrolase [Saprospirales bacterium]
MESLRVTLVQTALVWENPAVNMRMLEEKLRPLSGTTDLVILPEMFTTGFSMHSESLAENMDGPAVRWMQDMASQLGAVVTGSVIICDRGACFNRLLWVRPDGTYAIYDKRHLFSLAGEQHHYSAGTQRLLVRLKGWTICPLICYDLRFPVWSRNTQDYDLLIYVANWPKPRRHAWKSLLIARAIENQSYTVGVNRVGEDINGNEYTGDSMIVNFAGEVLYHIAYGEQSITITLDPAIQESFRAKFPFLNDGDDFQLK